MNPARPNYRLPYFPFTPICSNIQRRCAMHYYGDVDPCIFVFCFSLDATTVCWVQSEVKMGPEPPLSSAPLYSDHATFATNTSIFVSSRLSYALVRSNLLCSGGNNLLVSMRWGGQVCPPTHAENTFVFSVQK